MSIQCNRANIEYTPSNKVTFPIASYRSFNGLCIILTFSFLLLYKVDIELLEQHILLHSHRLQPCTRGSWCLHKDLSMRLLIYIHVWFLIFISATSYARIVGATENKNATYCTTAQNKKNDGTQARVIGAYLWHHFGQININPTDDDGRPRSK